jgi:hypothetical protein
MALPPYYKKEVIKIPDEVGLVISLLNDDLLNHRLSHLVPHDQVIREHPNSWVQFPAIYVRKIANTSLVTESSLGEDYDTGEEVLGSVWSADIALDIVAHVNTEFNYPPIELVGDLEEYRYKHAKNCLPVLQWIVNSVLHENRHYTDPSGSTLQFDTAEMVGYNLIDGGYSGVRDVWALQVVYRMQFEMEGR